MTAEILCIDDCTDIQETITDYLKMDGYSVKSTDSCEKAFEIINTSPPDLILLDLVLPTTDGLTFLKSLISQGLNIPVIMISGRGEDVDRIIGIEAGADDYLAKPFMPRELSARIKAVLKRTQNLAPTTVTPISTENAPPRTSFGNWILDRPKFQAFDQEGKSAELTVGEFVVLEKLISSKGQVLTRDQLFSLLHDHAQDTNDRAVDIQIARIRSKLGDNAKNPQYIKTVRGAGYMFIADTQPSVK